MEIKFLKIKNEDIFTKEYEDLGNGLYSIIEFKNNRTKGGMAVIYAPNGTGKSSLARVLDSENENSAIELEAEYRENKQRKAVKFDHKENEFLVIKDQLGRNIVRGNTSDYLVGDDIKREYELKDRIEEIFKDRFTNILYDIYKKKYKITKKSAFLLTKVKEQDELVGKFVENIIIAKSKGGSIDRKEFISTLADREIKKYPFDNEKMEFFLNNISEKGSIIENLIKMDTKLIKHSPEIEVLEQNYDAISIIKKYPNIKHCIVCDNSKYDENKLLKIKQESNRIIYEALNDGTKKLLNEISNISIEKDPFCICNTIKEFIKTNIDKDINNLLDELEEYLCISVQNVINELLDAFAETDLIKLYKEYEEILKKKPELNEEEIQLINEIVNNNIGKNICIERDDVNDKNYKIMIDDKSIVGLSCNELKLSTGEKNFISLAFDLLYARHSEKKFVVIDDPISSFDSVYKNKIAYCLIKFLDNKFQLILTHNTDLIRLLEVQQKGCFNLYMMINAEEAVNGFVSVDKKENKILINMYELIKLLQNREELERIIIDKKLFLMSMIPFMRGYAHISKDGNKRSGNDNKSLYEKLSDVMHGYSTGEIEASRIYNDLFGCEIASDIKIRTKDVLDLDCLNITDIINRDEYPLLAETLRQTLVYFHLRMRVEHELVRLFKIKCNTKSPLMLNDIILKAFPISNDTISEESKYRRSMRVFFTSRKTLLNEFNHFEGNMNIFQPAIDIEPHALQREVESIEAKIDELHNRYLDM